MGLDIQQINYTAGVALVSLSLLGLAAVLAGFRRPVGATTKGQRVQASPLFDTCVLAMCVVVVVYLATADFRVASGARPLAYCALAIVAALGARYWQREAR